VAANSAPHPETFYRCLRLRDGELRIDEKAFRVYHLGNEIKLAKKELELLLLLVRNRGSVVSRDRSCPRSGK